MAAFCKRYFPALVLAACGAWLWYSAAFDPSDGARRAAAIGRDIALYQKQNALAALEIEELRTRTTAAKEDPSRMEALARLRLQMIKSGEIFVMPTEEE